LPSVGLRSRYLRFARNCWQTSQPVSQPLSQFAIYFKHRLGPLMPGVYNVPFPNPYRCPFGAEADHDCAAHCLEFLRKTLRHNTSGRLAMILVEPIQGTAGNVVPPPGFLKGLKEIASEDGALLLSDEMITGFGRTGKLFGYMHEDVVPDVLTIGKGVAGGFPVSGLVTGERIARERKRADDVAVNTSYYGRRKEK